MCSVLEFQQIIYMLIIISVVVSAISINMNYYHDAKCSVFEDTTHDFIGYCRNDQFGYCIAHDFKKGVLLKYC